MRGTILSWLLVGSGEARPTLGQGRPHLGRIPGWVARNQSEAGAGPKSSTHLRIMPSRSPMKSQEVGRDVEAWQVVCAGSRRGLDVAGAATAGPPAEVAAPDGVGGVMPVVAEAAHGVGGAVRSIGGRSAEPPIESAEPHMGWAELSK